MKKITSRKISAFFKEVVDKFENKILTEKENGQYSGRVYTPNQIAEFIVRNLFHIFLKDIFEEHNLNHGQHLTNAIDLKLLSSIYERYPELKKSLIQRFENIKILDPACGSGRFLISAGNFLLQIYKLLKPNLQEFEIKKNIIQNILYGVELDTIAHNICKIRLFSWYLSSLSDKTSSYIASKFKSIENSTLNEILNESQISFHIYNSDFLLEFNSKEKFDIILGNPPYIENKKIKDTIFKKKIRKRFTSAYRLFDLSIVFLEKSLKLLKENDGYLSFLMTNKFLAADYGVKIRTILLKNSQIKEIINISSLPVFTKAAIYPIIISLRKRNSIESNNIKIQKCQTLDDLNKYNFIDLKFITQNSINAFPSKVIPIVGNIKLIRYLFSKFKPMSQVFKDLNVIYRPFGFLKWDKHFRHVSDYKNSENDLILLGTGNVGRFHIKYDKRIRIAKRDLKVSYFEYTDIFKDIWEDLSREKLIFREIAKKLTAVYDPGVFTNITGLYFIIIPSFTTNEYYCLLSLLNSKLIDSVFKSLFGTLHMSGNYLRFNGSFIKRLPMPDILPNSLSYLGKINQFLSQLIFEQYNSLINTEEITNYHNFFITLSDTLVSLLYLKEYFDISKMTNLLELLTQSEKDFPNIEFKYLTPRFNLPKFKTYSSNELKQNLLSIKNFYQSLSSNLMLINEISEFPHQDFYL